MAVTAVVVLGVVVTVAEAGVSKQVHTLPTNDDALDFKLFKAEAPFGVGALRFWFPYTVTVVVAVSVCIKEVYNQP